ncbi:Tol biopolymer transporter periplasmic protein [Spirulina subsalsa FACHB-351]|uniref:Tol biopolymer transporter periplasmic protein n=1 Tax=Spirulina subsalsa FACHB-351 TaxID=234711 RepID=A0ABT3L9Y4_9CYAN|nr:Tol biopolymer transporter periplasmic protein [Spirulina subsalsa]MCW6038310.1 Tol biopolymer transporter periplasmic protein [Spirulina subsalsa FACHB-351]
MDTTSFSRFPIKQLHPWLKFLPLLTLLTSCASYPKVLNFPYDTGGRGLNSPNSELTPHIASEYIVFTSDRNRSQDVYLFDASRRQLVELPGLNALDATASDPAISEDGRYIVYASSRLGRSDIYLYDRETGLNRNLTEGLQAQVRHPTINGDGSIIAFEANKDGQWDILVYDASGQPLR